MDLCIDSSYFSIVIFIFTTKYSFHINNVENDLKLTGIREICFDLCFNGSNLMTERYFASNCTQKLLNQFAVLKLAGDIVPLNKLFHIYRVTSSHFRLSCLNRI